MERFRGSLVFRKQALCILNSLRSNNQDSPRKKSLREELPFSHAHTCHHGGGANSGLASGGGAPPRVQPLSYSGWTRWALGAAMRGPGLSVTLTLRLRPSVTSSVVRLPRQRRRARGAL